MQLSIVDVYSLAYKAYFSQEKIITPDGQPITICNYFLTKLPLMLNGNFCVFVYNNTNESDSDKASFRKKLHPEYKKVPPETGEDFKQDLSRLLKIIQSLRITNYFPKGYDSEDIIGTLARQGENVGHVNIFTFDSRLLQLASEKTAIAKIDGSTCFLMTPDEIFKKYSLWPTKLADYKSIVGDSSTGIPGIKGIGDAGALELIKRFGSLDEIYANKDKIRKSLRDKLDASREDAFLSQKLTTIICDLPIKASLSKYLLNGDFYMDNLMNLISRTSGLSHHWGYIHGLRQKLLTDQFSIAS